MRQQYHSRKVGEDVLIWNVNKLVQHAKNIPTISVDLYQIKELDETFWYNLKDENQPTCRSIADHAKLIEETDLKYPILMCPEGLMIDGMHRVCKAYMRGIKTIKAIQFDSMPEPDYRNISLKDLPYD